MVLIPALLLIGGTLPAAESDAPTVAPVTAKAPKEACADLPRTAGLNPGQRPLFGTLADQPPAAHIAAVYARQDGCPVMLVLDGGEAGGQRGWVRTPEPALRPVR